VAIASQDQAELILEQIQQISRERIFQRVFPARPGLSESAWQGTIVRRSTPLMAGGCGLAKYSF
jgi:hypothetical protein